MRLLSTHSFRLGCSHTVFTRQQPTSCAEAWTAVTGCAFACYAEAASSSCLLIHLSRARTILVAAVPCTYAKRFLSSGSKARNTAWVVADQTRSTTSAARADLVSTPGCVSETTTISASDRSRSSAAASCALPFAQGNNRHPLQGRLPDGVDGGGLLGQGNIFI